MADFSYFSLVVMKQNSHEYGMKRKSLNELLLKFRTKLKVHGDENNNKWINLNWLCDLSGKGKESLQSFAVLKHIFFFNGSRKIFDQLFSYKFEKAIVKQILNTFTYIVIYIYAISYDKIKYSLQKLGTDATAM